MRLFWVPLAVFIAVTGVVFGGLGSGLDQGEALWTFAWVLWAPVGGLILWRRPGNRVGSAMLMTGLSWGLSFWLMPVLTWDIRPDALAWAELFNTIFGVVPWLGIIYLLVVFPTGSPAGRVERWISRFLVLFGTYATVAFALSPEPMESTGLASPLAVSRVAPLTDWIVGDQGFFVVIALLGATLVSLVRRWRRSENLERAQFRWILFGTSFYAVVVTAGQLLTDGSSIEVLWIAAGAAVPLSIAVAVLRYRLFEIDRIISRTVSYALLVALLGLLFAAGALWIPQAAGLENPLFVAGSTLAVAAFFNPLRRRVQRVVDRRFNRSRYDVERVIEDFAGSLRDQVDPDGVVEGWVGMVSETMQPSLAGVWIRR